MAKNNEPNSLAVNLISNGTTFKGDIQTDSDLRIDGVLNGTIQSKGKVIVGETGQVEGEVQCKNADISGKINANLKISELLTLKATAQINGEVLTKKLSIEEGAVFTANCRMDESSSTQKKTANAHQPKEKQQGK
ncbi:MAG: polymer-forming cytoskeletal protein [Bacteroidales bacterium]|nr:polymer-forming cytoskeletal protein [Bacteroidales bacterium]MCF8338410.1 polymer-forming cytoskeletal protein [Bacteroidales bacterium]